MEGVEGGVVEDGDLLDVLAAAEVGAGFDDERGGEEGDLGVGAGGADAPRAVGGGFGHAGEDGGAGFGEVFGDEEVDAVAVPGVEGGGEGGDVVFERLRVAMDRSVG